MNQDDAIDFLVAAGGALHRYGTAAHRLEATLTATARGLGLELHAFSTPTSLMLAFGPTHAQRVVLVRVTPTPADLGRLADVDALIADVAGGRTDVRTAQARLDHIIERPRRYPGGLIALAGGVSSAGAAVLFGGSPADVVTAGVLGLGVALLERSADKVPMLQVALPTVAAFMATAGARVGAALSPSVHPPLAALSAVVAMLPGLAFTTAMIELATANLASGVARLAGAAVSLLRLMLGVAIAQVLVPLVPPLPTTDAVPAWSKLVVLGVTPLCFGIVLKARRKDLWVTVVAGVVAWVGAVGGVDAIGPGIGAGVGALALATFASLYARLFDRPATVPLVAGSILLLPGSIGYRSLSALLAGDVLLGVEQAFQMAMVVTSLSAGIVLGATLVPTKRAL